MVRAIQVNSLGFVEWLLRVRPGIAISFILHAALLLFLAIVLAFPPNDPPAPTDDVIIDMRVPPAPPVIAPHIDEPPTPSLFDPDVAPALKPVATSVKELIIPPAQDFQRGPVVAVTPKQTPTPTIDKLFPISRGGLVYPSRAAERNVSGYVDFTFVVEPDGSVGDVKVIAEVPEGYGFADAARRAFATWRFEPKRIDGNPVAAQARYRITFAQR